MSIQAAKPEGHLPLGLGEALTVGSLRSSMAALSVGVSPPFEKGGHQLEALPEVRVQTGRGLGSKGGALPCVWRCWTLQAPLCLHSISKHLG